MDLDLQQFGLLIAIPILLIIGGIIYFNFQNTMTTQTPFINGFYTNESATGAGDPGNQNVTLTHYPIAQDPAPVFRCNGTGVLLTEDVNYTIESYIDGRVNFINIGGAASCCEPYIYFKYLDGTAYDTAAATYTNSYNALNMGTVLPIVMIAVMIITVIFAAMVFRRGQ